MLRTAFAILIFYSFGPAANAKICGVLQQTTDATSAAGPVTLYSGEILPVKSKSKTLGTFNLLMADNTVRVPRDKVKLLSGVACEPQVSTAEDVITTYYKPGKEPARTTIRPGMRFRVLSETRLERQTWLRVITDDSALVWILKKPERAPEAKAPASRIWRFGIEFAKLSGLSSDAYDGLVTSVPDSSNVGALQDPIITSVDKGTGYILRLFADRPLWQVLRGRVGLGYRNETYAYNYKSNPTLGAVTLGELNGDSRDIEIKRLQFDGGIGVEHALGALTLGYGFQIGALYNLSDEEKIDVLVPSGVFFKNTPAQVHGGPSRLELETWLRADARWRGAGLTVGFGLKGELMFGAGYSY